MVRGFVNISKTFNAEHILDKWHLLSQKMYDTLKPRKKHYLNIPKQKR